MNLRETNLRRIGARHRLHFYVDVERHTVVFPIEGQSRDATNEEIRMWTELCPEDPSHLPATQAEVSRSLGSKTGPFTVNPVDFVQVWGLPNYLPEENSGKIQDGLYGSLNGQAIYVSRIIPLGTYYNGPRLAKLHTGSDAMGPRLKDTHEEFVLWNFLQPFTI